MVRTVEIFPFDMDSKFLLNFKELNESITDSYVPHVDRVLRPEVICCFSKQIKSDLKKLVPGLIKRSDST